MTVQAFTIFHVVLSLMGLLSGGIVLAGLLGSRKLAGWTVVQAFLRITVLNHLAPTQTEPPFVIAQLTYGSLSPCWASRRCDRFTLSAVLGRHAWPNHAAIPHCTRMARIQQQGGSRAQDEE